jgi:hypothetical protein
MNNLAKVEEEQHKNRYLSYAEQQKHKEKTGIFIIQRLLLETTMMKKSLTETVLYHLPTWKPSMKVFSKTLLTGFQLVNIVGFSQENFKRFYKLPKVRQLTDCLYNVAFEI